MKRTFRRRGASPVRRYGAKSSRVKNRLKVILKKLLICAIIVAVVLLIKGLSIPIAQNAAEGIKGIITAEFNLRERINFLRSAIPSFKEKVQRVFGDQEQPSSMIMPVDGPVISGYGMRVHPVLNIEKMHQGIDIDAETGEPVRAALGGVIAEVRTDSYYGNIVIIDHGNQLKTVYGHLGEVKVKEGQQVSQGDTIGLIGNTGISTGSHLHFEVWKEGKPVDPITYLKPDTKGM